jgi:thiamine monophosphate synthase
MSISRHDDNEHEHENEHGNSSSVTSLPPPRSPTPRPFLIGTSAHDVDSALNTWNKYQPDYFFVGTCFITLTHPEKQQDDLEGPLLPGQVKRSILQQVLVAQEEEEEQQCGACPLVFAVGGINVDNCRVPIEFGADGVAMIRAVMQAPNPREMVQIIHDKMVIT